MLKLLTRENLLLVNDLGIELGSSSEEILTNLQTENYNIDHIQFPNKLASDNVYQERLRNVDATYTCTF